MKWKGRVRTLWGRSLSESKLLPTRMTSLRSSRTTLINLSFSTTRSKLVCLKIRPLCNSNNKRSPASVHRRGGLILSWRLGVWRGKKAWHLRRPWKIGLCHRALNRLRRGQPKTILTRLTLILRLIWKRSRIGLSKSMIGNTRWSKKSRTNLNKLQN